MTRPATRPKLTDVNYVTAHLLPITACTPPAGQRCTWEAGLTGPTLAHAKGHALANPGHQVVRETITRTRLIYMPDPDGAA